jgi:hypothetical protein
VRRILRALEEIQQGPAPTVHESQTARADRRAPDDLKERFKRAEGNVVRLQEMLQSERGQDVPYSTLTRWVREAELREVPERAGEYVFQPGE